MAFLRLRRKKKFDSEALQQQIVATLKRNLWSRNSCQYYDLGLIYSINIDTKANVKIAMTLTTPACPVAQTFQVRSKTR